MTFDPTPSKLSALGIACDAFVVDYNKALCTPTSIVQLIASGTVKQIYQSIDLLDLEERILQLAESIYYMNTLTEIARVLAWTVYSIDNRQES